MAEWLVEEGIGEHRAILIEGGDIVAARIDWPGALAAGQVEDAKLVSRSSGTTRGTARFANGEEVLVDGLPRDAAEGATLRLRITRAAIAETGRAKLAHARPTDENPHPAPSLAEALDARVVRRFPIAGWSELIAEACAGEVRFAGGSLLLSPTPAMTLIDIDGELPARQLALAAVEPIAHTLQRLDIGGSVGIDFPTLNDKADRRAVDEALGAALARWPHERTAMNGFGFVQLVARLERPSILQRAARDPAGIMARLLMRQAEGIADPGALLLTCHPSVGARLSEDWLTELRRTTGREVRIDRNPAVAPEGGFAQAIAL